MKFERPFRALLSGPSLAGKTRLLVQLLKAGDKGPLGSFTRIVYCYGTYLRETFDEDLSADFNIKLVAGLPDTDELAQFDEFASNLLIIDDLIDEAVNSKLVSDLFVRESHHRNICVVLISQNLFHKGRYNVTINRNCNYTFIFKNPRDEAQLLYLARQLYPRNAQVLMEAYRDSVRERAYGYLLIDSAQNTPDKYRLRTDLLNPIGELVYKPKLSIIDGGGGVASSSL